MMPTGRERHSGAENTKAKRTSTSGFSATTTKGLHGETQNDGMLRRALDIVGQRLSRLFLKPNLPLPGGAYTLGFVLVALTMALRLTFETRFDIPNLVIFVPAILVTAAGGGFRAGFATTLFSCFGAEYFLIPPIYSFDIRSPGALSNFLSLASSGTLVAAVTAILRAAIQKSETAKAALGRALKSTSQLAAIVESSSDAIVSCSSDGTVTTFNPAAERMYGYAAGEMVGRSFYDVMSVLVTNDRIAEEKEVIERVLAGEQVPAFETVRLRKDRSSVFVFATTSPIRDENGNVVGFSRIVRDISERKKLEEQTAFQAAIVSCSAEGLIGFSPDGIIRSWNKSAERIYGYTAEEVLGTRMYDRPILPEDAVSETAQLKNALAGNVVEPFEAQRIRKDGTRIDVEVTISPVRDAQGDFLGVSSIVRDITEKKAYAREKALLSSVVESLNDAIYTKNFDGIITSCNRAAEELFGYTAAELIGQPMTILFPPEQIAGEMDLLEKIRAGDVVKPFEAVRLRKDGVRIETLVTISPIRDETGRIVGASKLLRDISERKRVEREVSAGRAKLEAAFESMADGIIISDLDGRVEFNEAFARVQRFASSAECFTVLKEYTALFEASTPEGEPITFEQWPLSRALRGETAMGFEMEVRRKDSGERWIATYNFAPIRSDGGQITGAVCTLRDITERKKSEAELKESLDRLEKVLDNQTVGAMFWDVNTGALVDANQTFFELMGYTREDVEARRLHWQDLTPPEFMDISQAELEKFLETGRVGPYEKEYFCKDGSRKWLLFAGSSLGNNQCIEFCVDISERKRAEQALVESDTKLRAVLDALPVAVMFTEPGGEVSMVNQALETIWGASVPLGKADSGRYRGWWPGTGQQLGAEDWPCARALLGQTTREAEVEIETFAGDRKFISVYASPLSGPNGENFGAITVQQDITERKHAEEKLRAAQDRLNIALSAAQMGTWEWHIRESRSIWNAQMYHLLGLDVGDGLESSDVYMRHVHPDDLTGLHASVETLQGADWRYEHRIVRRDGEVRWVVDVGRVIRDAQGLPEMMYGVTYDVTGLKVAEAEAKASRDKLAAAMGSMSEGVFITDAAREFVHLNEAFARINRFPSIEACLNSIRDLNPRFDLFTTKGASVPKKQRPFYRALQGESGASEEYIVKRNDTAECWIASFNFAPIRDEQGNVTGMVATERDVTDRKLAEETLRRSEERYRMLHESMRDAFVQTTLDGHIIDLNDAYCDMLGYTADELRTKSYQDLTPERWHAVDAAQVSGPILTRGYSDVYEKEYVRKDGTVIPVELRVMMSSQQESEPGSLWAIVRDLSERKEIERRMRTMQEELAHVGRLNELGQVSAGIAHELNQPLAAMMNYSNVAKRLIASHDALNGEKALDAITRATEQAQRAGTIIRRMRSFIEKRETNREVEAINTIVEDAVALALIGARADGITTNLNLGEGLPPVLADRLQIQQVLVNLLRNAVDAMDASSTKILSISTQQTIDNKVEIVVEDTGSGMAKDVADRIFMPFFTTKQGGMGIGLVISRNIVEAHGGQISVASVPGAGTVFRFTLPVASDTGEVAA